MNRTIKDATAKRFYYDGHSQCRHYLARFVAAYNFARRLKTPRVFTPYEATGKPGRRSPLGSPGPHTTKARDQTAHATEQDRPDVTQAEAAGCRKLGNPFRTTGEFGGR